ncbi:nitrate reductase NapAB chaperone NapD [Bacillus mesophilus]|nr:cytosolic protein [Bacillus mesophilus]MBM7660583.1 nitrate reductase NapAB chaperone NapD [Bacillus mesophilus]
MSFQKIKQFFSKHCETKDHHDDPLLKTHYYKTNKAKALTAVEELIRELPGYKITSVSTEHGELSVEITAPKKAFLVITVISVRPIETAVDFSLTYEGLINLGYSRAMVVKLYTLLDQKLTRIGN